MTKDGWVRRWNPFEETIRQYGLDCLEILEECKTELEMWDVLNTVFQHDLKTLNHQTRMTNASLRETKEELQALASDSSARKEEGDDDPATDEDLQETISEMEDELRHFFKHKQAFDKIEWLAQNAARRIAADGDSHCSLRAFTAALINSSRVHVQKIYEEDSGEDLWGRVQNGDGLAISWLKEANTTFIIQSWGKEWTNFAPHLMTGCYVFVKEGVLEGFGPRDVFKVHRCLTFETVLLSAETKIHHAATQRHLLAPHELHHPMTKNRFFSVHYDDLTSITNSKGNRALFSSKEFMTLLAEMGLNPLNVACPNIFVCNALFNEHTLGNLHLLARQQNAELVAGFLITTSKEWSQSAEKPVAFSDFRVEALFGLKIGEAVSLVVPDVQAFLVEDDTIPYTFVIDPMIDPRVMHNLASIFPEWKSLLPRGWDFTSFSVCVSTLPLISDLWRETTTPASFKPRVRIHKELLHMASYARFHNEVPFFTEETIQHLTNRWSLLIELVAEWGVMPSVAGVKMFPKQTTYHPILRACKGSDMQKEEWVHLVDSNFTQRDGTSESEIDDVSQVARFMEEVATARGNERMILAFAGSLAEQGLFYNDGMLCLQVKQGQRMNAFWRASAQKAFQQYTSLPVTRTATSDSSSSSSGTPQKKKKKKKTRGKSRGDALRQRQHEEEREKQRRIRERIASEEAERIRQANEEHEMELQKARERRQAEEEAEHQQLKELEQRKREQIRQARELRANQPEPPTMTYARKTAASGGGGGRSSSSSTRAEERAQKEAFISRPKEALSRDFDQRQQVSHLEAEIRKTDQKLQPRREALSRRHKHEAEREQELPGPSQLSDFLPDLNWEVPMADLPTAEEMMEVVAQGLAAVTTAEQIEARPPPAPIKNTKKKKK